MNFSQKLPQSQKNLKEGQKGLNCFAPPRLKNSVKQKRKSFWSEKAPVKKKTSPQNKKKPSPEKTKSPCAIHKQDKEACKMVVFCNFKKEVYVVKTVF